ncbi:YjbQ family protein [Desertifilum sp. FACHB-1129]|uniref:Secondary thiamine-phosphate synthase enzyme n=1 Tax=Desertifilum tharense IPPAS B-1220 TaxID=1781255 RepID=A0A1E5QMB2_9CYAN|nr:MULTISPECIES: secondary thiamine-phosphate synthase enzyme YjbQ [Desertifilum]MDA0213356.1 secondary thiamine-phosphate synthase enzyme YjbQ [Cyanobacteria bacterium FC1]MBD2313706.1 YjbQ family protein [Desertifilum sp. FACHB-1129]MBD2325000.1 YjbQ family protein [Desertifilum sp. FACHB-866]MBD2335139.1 YjbQ family protein [Desertifilum sp. FACHB-868]OEJ75734.1 secondary thiamine-phosphate synthase enzyme [Desertifilum tharense IPPAS B-1220]
MKIKSELLNIETETGIQIYNLTPKVQDWIERVGLQNGQITLFSRHTTTALAINEYEERLLVDIKAYLNKLAPENDRYLHNDLHLRVVPPDEPMNAHSHLMAMTLSTSEVIPVMDSKLALGTWQSLLFFELDGPRQRTVLVQALGEFE